MTTALLKLKPVSILGLFCLLPLCGCSTSTPVISAGQDVFVVSTTGTTGYTPLGSLRSTAYKKATEFAELQSGTAEVISVNETPAGFAVWPKVDVMFRVYRAGTKRSGVMPIEGLATQRGPMPTGGNPAGANLANLGAAIAGAGQIMGSSIQQQSLIQQQNIQQRQMALIQSTQRSSSPVDTTFKPDGVGGFRGSDGSRIKPDGAGGYRLQGGY